MKLSLTTLYRVLLSRHYNDLSSAQLTALEDRRQTCGRMAALNLLTGQLAVTNQQSAVLTAARRMCEAWAAQSAPEELRAA